MEDSGYYGMSPQILQMKEFLKAMNSKEHTEYPLYVKSLFIIVDIYMDNMHLMNSYYYRLKKILRNVISILYNGIINCLIHDILMH